MGFVLWLVGNTAMVGFLFLRNLKRDLPIHSGGKDGIVTHRNPKRVLVPDDLIVEILSFLPVKDVLRFKCVCKSWQNITLDSRFIQKHMMHMRRSKSETVYEEKCKPTNDNVPKFRLRLDRNRNDLLLEKSEKSCNEETFLLNHYNNGLVLEESEKTGKYRIRNPATKQVLQVLDDPEEQGMWRYIFMGFVSSPNNLICFHLKKLTYQYGIKILTVGTDLSWRPLDISLPWDYGIHHYFKFTYDMMFIISLCEAELEKTEIIRFMLKDESFMKIKIPQYFQTGGRRYQFKTFAWEDKLSLGFIINKELHVWVLEDHKNHVWSEKKIILLDLIIKDYPNLDKNIDVFGVSMGQLVATLDDNMLVYDIDSKKGYIVKEPRGRKVLYDFVPCLVSLKGMHSDDINSWRVVISLQGMMRLGAAIIPISSMLIRFFEEIKGLWKFM